jgi:hypothetical protein
MFENRDKKFFSKFFRNFRRFYNIVGVFRSRSRSPKNFLLGVGVRVGVEKFFWVGVGVGFGVDFFDRAVHYFYQYDINKQDEVLRYKLLTSSKMCLKEEIMSKPIVDEFCCYLM